jgi:hypothetical protein
VTNLTVSRLLADRRGLRYIQLHVLYTGRAYRLFGGGKKQGQASEPLEMGDLLRGAFEGGQPVDRTSTSGLGPPWHLARSKALSVGLSNAHFKSLGLPSLIEAR